MVSQINHMILIELVLNLNKSKKILKLLKCQKENNNTNKPNVSIQTLITSLSFNEKKDMVEWAKKIGADSIYFKSLNLSMGNQLSKEMIDKWSFLLPKDDKFKRHQFKFDYPVCNIPRNQSVVYWNGNLGLCCVEFENDEVFFITTVGKIKHLSIYNFNFFFFNKFNYFRITNIYF